MIVQLEPHTGRQSGLNLILCFIRPHKRKNLFPNGAFLCFSVWICVWCEYKDLVLFAPEQIVCKGPTHQLEVVQ